MSALWRRVSGAQAPGGAQTTQTYILGVGASGALLAGAGVALISLVGLVSFDVWPGTPAGGGAAEEQVQLNFGGSDSDGGTSLSEIADLLSSESPIGVAESPASGVPDGNGDGRRPKSDKPAPVDNRPTAPATPAPVAPVDEGGGGGSGSNGSGSTGNSGSAPNTPAPSQSRNPNARSDPPGHVRNGGGRNASGGSVNPGRGNGSRSRSTDSGTTVETTQPVVTGNGKGNGRGNGLASNGRSKGH